jgi:hypothetical protein
MVLTPAGTGSVLLNGTGQNFIFQSNTFNNAAWSTSLVTVATTVATLDPFGGSNAWILTATGAGVSGVGQNISNLNSTYTLSVYAKAGTSTWLRLFATSLSPYAWFNLSTGALGTVQSGATATITSVGNGWYRCTVSSVSNGSLGIRLADVDASTNATNGSTLYIYGAQLEFGSTTNSYVPTTTTQIYNAPQLSFSGVSSIGLQSDGSMYVQPAGTGALQANITNSAVSGGNARGANAVDWQTARYTASQVASGSTSVIAGGTSNVASGGSAAICGGYDNRATGSLSFIGSGTVNTSSGVYSSISAGNLNAATGYYGFVGNGFTNSTTSNSAVTTQSGTMNATTAVTLSGSNANIKVGQYITGTSIASDTYVAAISGTSLTLSKVASGSSTSTLSFFTPHGVVVGGGNNQATGSYSFIGGGGDGGTAANRNVASGDWSTVGGGIRNQATGTGSIVCGGADPFFSGANLASAAASAIIGGAQNTASGYQSTVLGGTANIASGAASRASGHYATTRGILGAFANGLNGFVSYVSGACQYVTYLLYAGTTNETATVVTADGGAASGTNQVILPNNSAYFFTGEVVSGVTGGGNTKGWTIEGVIKRGANAASTALVGTPTVSSLYADAGAATWTIALSADTTNGGLSVTFTGQAGTTIRTVAQIRTTEMTY